MSTTIYVVLSADRKSIGTYCGESNQDPEIFPSIASVQSSDQIYHDYYAYMTTLGMQVGMIEPTL